MKNKDSEIQPLIAVQRDDIQHKKESKKQKYRETKMKRHNIRNKDTKICTKIKLYKNTNNKDTKKIINDTN